MPKATRDRVFLSYAHEDLKISQKIEQTLRNKEIEVWRDQESLYGGQQWPKAIGEALSSSDFFILVWSRHSAASHFVEFEWNTAVALKKTIIPCLLDDTPLPISLRAINSIYLKDFENALLKILHSLQATVQKKDSERSSDVIKKLAAIPDIEPAKVVTEVKSIFSNEDWSVKGNMYQAAGDIHLTIQKPAEGKKGKIFDKWQTWVAFFAAVLTIVTLLFEIPQKIENLFKAEKPNSNITQVLAGEIVDERGNPLPRVTVELPEYELLDETDERGKFHFEVNAPNQAQVVFRARKEGYETINLDPSLGDKFLNFKMGKKND